MNTSSTSGIGRRPSGKCPPAVRDRRNGARCGATLVAIAAAALIGYAGAAMADIAKFSPAGLQVQADAGRVALVIGNGDYVEVSRDPSAHRDAAGVGAALGRLGFTVTTLTDAGYADMLQGLVDFAQAAQSAQVAVVFYVGHGNAAEGRNFLMPVDMRERLVRVADERDLHVTEGNRGWVPVTWLMRSVEGASNLRLVILDTDVLAPLEPTGNTLVAVASKEEHSIAGTDGGNSPYTEALLRYLEEPGLDVGMLFRKVRDDVMRATDRRQEPFVYGLPGWGVYLGASSGQPPTVELDLPNTTEEALVR